jgi:SAM-dependent methyltransferase
VDYVRCVELPLVFEALALAPGMRVLDVGCRDSIFPLYLAKKTGARVCVFDLDVTVAKQRRLAAKLGLTFGRGYHAVRGDVRSTPFATGTFDRVSLVSTIEHVPGEGDSAGVAELARVLKPGGRLVLTVPFGDSPRDFFMSEKVYSQEYAGKPVFFQRHYNEETLEHRLIGPSGLRVAGRSYFGEPRVAFFNTFWVLPGWLKPVKVFYNWLGPVFSRWFMGVFDDSSTLKLRHPPMVNANGAFLVLEKPGSTNGPAPRA